MMPSLNRKRPPSTVLGLSLDGSRLEAVLVRRTNGSLAVLKRMTATLALNPVNGAPELVGREIRNHLEQAGMREKRCVVCLPLSWALTAQTTVPAIAETDVDDFLALEAERLFPYSPDSLLLATSRCRAGVGEHRATLAAIPRHQLVQLEAVLRAAQLRPAGFTLGITCLLDPSRDAASGVIALAPGEHAVDVLVACHGGAATLRSLDEAIETEGVQQRLDAEQLARALRVTLGQMPSDLRAMVRTVRVYGSTDAASRLVPELIPRMSALGLQVELVRAYSPDEFRSRPPADTPVSPALSFAARHVTGVPNRFEFLPPRVTAWQQITSRLSSRKFGSIGAAAAVLALLVLGGIAYQQWQLSSLRARWKQMAPRVAELENMQAQIRRFRPWFDESFQTLSILRRVTEAFPETGVVTARVLEIRDSAAVTCSGTARDNQSFLRMLDQLRAAKEVGNVKVDQLRGKAPLQFTLNFQWAPGGTGEN